MPCEGIGQAMTKRQVGDSLKSLPQWALGEDGKSIERRMVFKNFVQAVEAINHIKDIAEFQGHHPDLHLTSYKNLRVVLYTHALGGVTQNDFIVAFHIDQQYKTG